MKKTVIHIHQVLRHILQHEMSGNLDTDHHLYATYQKLDDLAKQLVNFAPDTPEDRLMDKEKFIGAVMATNFEGRTGNIRIDEIRDQLERAYDMGTLVGIGQEREQTYNVVCSIKDGTFYDIRSDRPNIRFHKIDIDDHAEDTVLYQPIFADWDSQMNVNKIVSNLEKEFGY